MRERERALPDMYVAAVAPDGNVALLAIRLREREMLI